MSDDDDWGITPDYKNTMTEQEQRFGKQAVPGKIGHVNLDKLRQDVIKSDTETKMNSVPKASYGYGGKFGVEQDRMDKSAMGADYKSETSQHSSQQDYAKGFGGRYGVQSDRQDKSAVGYDHREEIAKHSSQQDYSTGFGGKYGVQKDRVDASSVGFRDTGDSSEKHPSQMRAEVTAGGNRASELRARFEKLALDQNVKTERPARPSVGKLPQNIFNRPPPVAELRPAPHHSPTLKPVEKPQPEPSKPEPAVATAPSTVEVPQPELVVVPPEPEPEETVTEPINEAAMPMSEKEVHDSGITAVACFDFNGSQDDELSFKAGDTISHVVKFDATWWQGCVGDRRGIFPSNYVTEGSGEPGELKTAPDAVSTITALALYDFIGSQDDELSFKAGDHIEEIVKFDTTWWVGRLGNKTGIFPSNYVSED